MKIRILFVLLIAALFVACEKEEEVKIKTVDYEGLMYHGQGVAVTAVFANDTLYIEVYGPKVIKGDIVFGNKSTGYEFIHASEGDCSFKICTLPYKRQDIYFSVGYTMSTGAEVSSFAYLTVK